MAKFRLLWAAAIWAVVVMVVSGSIYEMPLQTLNEATLNQGGNNLNTGPRDMEKSSEDINKDLGQNNAERVLLLFKILQAMRLRGEDAGSYHRVTPESADYLDVTQNMPEAAEPEKVFMAKRFTGEIKPVEIKAVVKPNTSVAPSQRRWKAKKGSQMICYFKLCAFRIPS